MLRFNLTNLFQLRGIKNPIHFLVSKGYHKDTAYRIVNNKAKNLMTYQIEDFCKWLNCTPNDLYEWTPGKNDDPANYPALMKLSPVKITDFSLLAKDIPIEKVQELMQKIEEMKKGI